MHFRNLTAIASFLLLAGCGGSEPAAESSLPASAQSAAALPADTPAEPAATMTGGAAGTPSSSVPGEAETVPTPTGASSSSIPVAAASAMAAAVPPPEFAVCRACHSVEKGRNGVGPTLFGIVGTKAGDVPGYNFSPALKASGIVWNRDTLDTWLAGPMKMVPGTKMVMVVNDPARRKALIDYLEQLK